MPIIHAIDERWAHIWKSDEQQCGNVFVPQGSPVDHEDLPLGMVDDEV